MHEVWTANGNVFAVRLDDSSSRETKQETTLSICNENLFLDGVLFLCPDQKTMEIFDRDGTYEDMCGNGLRVAATIIRGLASEELTSIETGNGPKKVLLHPSGVEVEITRDVDTSKAIMNIAGVPHIVVPKILPHEEAKKLRTSTGANVTCFSKDNLFYRTFEIGVERFTQSCGTGAVAIAARLGLNDLNLNTPSGILRVRKCEGAFYLSGKVEKLR